MFLYGASGHAKVIIDILRAGHESIEALFDDNVEVTSLLGHPVLRPSEVRGPLIVSIGNTEEDCGYFVRGVWMCYSSFVHCIRAC